MMLYFLKTKSNVYNHKEHPDSEVATPWDAWQRSGKSVTLMPDLMAIVS
jgi:hypothetical protein